MPPYEANANDPLGGRPAGPHAGQLKSAFDRLQKSIDTMQALESDLELAVMPVLVGGRGRSEKGAKDASPVALSPRSPTVESVLAAARSIEEHSLYISTLIERITT